MCFRKWLLVLASVMTAAAIGCSGESSSTDDEPAVGALTTAPAKVECDLVKATCEIPVPTCPSGEVPSVERGCFGPCVTRDRCSGAADAGAGQSTLDAASPPECDIQKATCEIPMPTCPSGQTPSVTSGCFGPCVKIETCKRHN